MAVNKVLFTRRTLLGLIPGTVCANKRWWDLKSLRSLVPKDETVLAYLAGPSSEAPRFAFLATTSGGEHLSVVLQADEAAGIPGRALVYATGPRKVKFSGRERSLISGKNREQLLELSADKSAAEAVCLSGVDLIGAVVNEWVVLFHTERHSARSPLSFYFDGEGEYRFLITGVAPGTWDVWHNGWLAEQVEAPAGGYCMYFEGPAGDYFLRRQS